MDTVKPNRYYVLYTGRNKDGEVFLYSAGDGEGYATWEEALLAYMKDSHDNRFIVQNVPFIISPGLVDYNMPPELTKIGG